MNKIKLTLSVALTISMLFDIITFIGLNLRQFEVNPLYLMTKSLIFLIGFKIIVNGAIILLIYKYKPCKSHFFAYMLVLITIYAIIGQTFGGYTNMNTAKAYHETVGTPQEIKPMEQSQAVKTYAWYSFIFLYMPIINALIAFLLYEKLYRIN